MKKLSIEEKAKRYDEAIEKAKQLSKELTVDDIVEQIFPELKESEDEKTKRILHTIANKMGQHLRDIFTEEEYQCFDAWSNAWLEKQVEQKPLTPKEKLRALSDGKRHLGWLDDAEKIVAEKQKHADMFDPYSLPVSDDSGLPTFNEDIYHPFTEKAYEQKHTDKVEPKFHKGDWIINSLGTLRHIIKVDKGCYKTDGGYLSHDTYEKTFHLWTIQDAKDGDVLVSNDASFIVLFKGLSYLEDDIYRFKSYCYYREGIFSPIEDPGWCCNAFHPATKEQREQLEKAMADAGYTFDVEKKELKKIEQKPAGSEEDIKTLERIVCILDGIRYYNTVDSKQEKLYQSEIDWLNSLKERVQPQSQWKPSDEEINTLWDAIVYVEGFNSNFKGSGSVLEKLYNDLKKLREE